MSDSVQNSCIPDTRTADVDVLIFSNDKGFIDYHSEILRSIGLAPVTAPSLEAAFALLRARVIELAIVDEEAGTFDTHRILKRASDSGQSVPVLVVSQRFDAALRRQALELGAAAYLDRPALQDDVVRALLAHCARRGNSASGPYLN